LRNSLDLHTYSGLGRRLKKGYKKVKKTTKSVAKKSLKGAKKAASKTARVAKKAGKGAVKYGKKGFEGILALQTAPVKAVGAAIGGVSKGLFGFNITKAIPFIIGGVLLLVGVVVYKLATPENIGKAVGAAAGNPMALTG